MITVRIRFEKTGEAAYISLLDLQRVFHRILKRSGLPVYYTQGFNPHIYLSFACPLSLGQESLCECCEVKTEAEDPQLDTWCDVLQPYMPRGIKVLSAQQAQNKVAEIDHASYLVTLPASAAAALDAYNAAENAMVVKKTKRGQKELDLKTIIPHVEYEQAGEQLQFNLVLPCGSGEAPNYNPALLLGYFFEKLLVAQGLSGPDDVVVLCTKKYHQEMLSFLFPRIRSVVAKPRVLRHLTDDADAGDWRIQICFPGRYFAQLENTTRRPDGPENFFTWMRDYFGVKKNDSRFFAARRPDSERLAAELSSALQKLDVSREDLTRTVILSPSSFSCGRLTGAEIETVKECAANSGMRLYCNPSDPQDPRFLSFPELYAAATQAAGLVAIRSGFP